MIDLRLPIDSLFAGDMTITDPVAQALVFRRGNIVTLNTRMLPQQDVLHQHGSKRFVVDSLDERGNVNISAANTRTMHLKVLGIRPHELNYISEK